MAADAPTAPGAEALIVVLPAATAVTGTVTELDPAGITVELPTVAFVGFVEASVIVNPPPGATDDALSVRLAVLPVSTLSVEGLKVSVI
jgi:hypothetical protein